METETVNRRRTDNTMDKKNKDKKTNHRLQNTTQKSKDRATQTPLKTDGELRCSGRVALLFPLVTPVLLLLNETNIV